MNKVIVIVGDRKSKFCNFNICKLFHTGLRFDTVFVDKISCSGVDIAKNVALSRVKTGDVAVVKNNKGDVFYYHPKYRRWYKNLSVESLQLYFYWLIPYRGQ